MDNKKCPKCGSTNIHQGGEYAMSLKDDEVQKPNIQPNECRECGHKWPHQV